MATAAKRLGNYGRNADNFNTRFRTNESVEFEEILTDFIRSRKNGTGTATRPNRERSVKDYEYTLKRFFDWMREHGVKRYSDMQRNHVADFIDHYQSLPLKQSSKSHVFRAMKALFNFTRKDGQWSEKGLSDFTPVLPRIPKNERRVYLPSPEAVTDFLKSFDLSVFWGLRDYVVTSMILDCGIRIGEACELTPECIKWEQDMMLIPDGKTGSRLVPLNKEKMLPLLKKWLRERERYAKTPFLFVNKYGGKCRPTTFDQSFEEVRTRFDVGVSKEGCLTPHTLRHFFCTYYLVNGGTLQALQQITGHESMSTLMIYVHFAGQIKFVAAEHSRVSPLKNLPERSLTTNAFKKKRMVR